MGALIDLNHGELARVKHLTARGRKEVRALQQELENLADVAEAEVALAEFKLFEHVAAINKLMKDLPGDFAVWFAEADSELVAARLLCDPKPLSGQ